MYWPITHMVAPKERALQCDDCHAEDENGVMDWRAWATRATPCSTAVAAERMEGYKTIESSEGSGQ